MGAGRPAPPHPFQAAPTPTRTRNSSQETSARRAYRLEWSLKAKTKLCWPNMPPEARKIATKAAPGAQLIRQHSALWKALQEFFGPPTVALQDAIRSKERSGQVKLIRKTSEDGPVDVHRIQRRQRVVAALAGKPTLFLDGTLPHLDLIRPFFPAIEVIADIEIDAPHAHIRQVPDAPTTAAAFAGPNGKA